MAVCSVHLLLSHDRPRFEDRFQSGDWERKSLEPVCGLRGLDETSLWSDDWVMVVLLELGDIAVIVAACQKHVAAVTVMGKKPVRICVQLSIAMLNRAR